MVKMLADACACLSHVKFHLMFLSYTDQVIWTEIEQFQLKQLHFMHTLKCKNNIICASTLTNSP